MKERELSPLQAFTKCLIAEYRQLAEKGEFKNACKLLKEGRQTEYFQYLKERALNSDLPWQDVLVSTRYWFHKLWRAMSLAEKALFLKRYGALWATWRHPIPLSSFDQLLEALQEERLAFYKATGRPFYSNGAFSVQTKNETLISEYLWDATGGSSLITSTSCPMLRQMINDELIEPHCCGGISIDTETYEVQVKRKAVKGLYNIGPLNKGELFSTNAFWFNVRCSEKWAHQWGKRFLENQFKENEVAF